MVTFKGGRRNKVGRASPLLGFPYINNSGLKERENVTVEKVKK